MLTPTLMPFPSPLTHDKQMSSVPKSKRPREDPSLNEHYYFLKEAVLSNAVVVHQPQMSALAASELIRKSKEFGKNPTKDRAIGQDDLMDSWSKEHGPLGSFLQLVDDFMSEMGPIGNKFMALNNGKLREKSFHTDKRFDPEPEYRIVCNYNDGEGEVGLIFRLKGTNVTFKILTPKGCALVFPRSFLTDEQFEHAHLGSGSCNFSVIYDFFACEAMLVGLTEVEIIAAAVNAVPFVQTFPEGGWTFFTGLWRKWYFGGGSIWRIAVGFIAGPSMGKGQRRNVPLKEARLIVSKMSVEERSKIASTAMSMRGKIGGSTDWDRTIHPDQSKWQFAGISSIAAQNEFAAQYGLQGHEIRFPGGGFSAVAAMIQEDGGLEKIKALNAEFMSRRGHASWASQEASAATLGLKAYQMRSAGGFSACQALLQQKGGLEIIMARNAAVAENRAATQKIWLEGEKRFQATNQAIRSEEQSKLFDADARAMMEDLAKKKKPMKS